MTDRAHLRELCEAAKKSASTQDDEWYECAFCGEDYCNGSDPCIDKMHELLCTALPALLDELERKEGLMGEVWEALLAGADATKSFKTSEWAHKSAEKVMESLERTRAENKRLREEVERKEGLLREVWESPRSEVWESTPIIHLSASLQERIRAELAGAGEES